MKLALLLAVLFITLAGQHRPAQSLGVIEPKAHLPFISHTCTPNLLTGPLCVLIVEANPVPKGATAYAMWNIKNMKGGEFDRGDGMGFRGPIATSMRVEVPNVTADRVVRLRWTDNKSRAFEDVVTLYMAE